MMSHRPTCWQCEQELRVKKNGVIVIDMAGDPPTPYAIWEADLWECRGCGLAMAAGFGQQSIAEHWQEGFAKHLQWAQSQQYVKYNYEWNAKRDRPEPSHDLPGDPHDIAADFGIPYQRSWNKERP